MKKQIVFVEHPNTTFTYKIARSLKLSGRYETILITFSKTNKKFLKGAYDKIIDFELSHKVNPKNLLTFTKRVLSPDFRKFLRDIKKLDPYLFQITGPDLFNALTMFILKNRPKIYFAYDIWAFNDKKFALNRLGIKEFFQKKFEKICFKKADGVIHKSAPESLSLLSYLVNKPQLPLDLLCLDESIIPPKKKKKQKNKEIHIAYAGGPEPEWPWRISFLKIIKEITDQKIHFHTYGSCFDRQDDKLFRKEAQNNKYFHMHDRIDSEKLKKELSKYDYGIVPAFLKDSIIDPRLKRTSVANKMYDYTESGIPVILGVPAKFASEIVKKNKVGICIESRDVKNLREILSKIDYKKMQKDIKKAQENTKLSKKIHEVEKFYESIVNKTE